MITLGNGTVTIEGQEQLEAKMKALKTDSPGFEKRLRDAIKKVLGEVRKKLQGEAQSGLQMQSDPRNAYKAVRYAVYKRIFGGQVNILDSRKASKSSYEPARNPSQRGGNRMARSQRTKDLMEYQGASRGFVLRFLNAGTDVRYAGSGRNGRTEAEKEAFILKTDGRGYRGRIAPHNWFGPRSQHELENAAGRIQEIIDRVINDEFV